MVERKEILSNLRHKKSEKKNTMVQLIGNFDFAALCLPTVPWGKSTRKMQFFRKVYHNHLQIDRYRCCFFESFFLMCLFLRPGSIYFFSSPPIIFPPQLNFPPVEIIRRRRSFGFNSGKIRWDSACIRRNECSFVLCARFWVDVCVWRREKETAKARSAIFPVDFKRLFWGGGVPPPLNHH